MALRFRRSASFLGGLIRLNLSKSGISMTAGVPGAHVNIGRKGVVATASAPGTGLSFRQRLSRSIRDNRRILSGDE